MPAAVKAPRLRAREAAVHPRMTAWLRGHARFLCPHDTALADDCLQAGLLAILTLSKVENTIAWWQTRAKWRMADYLRKERVRMEHAEMDGDGRVLEFDRPDFANPHPERDDDAA